MGRTAHAEQVGSGAVCVKIPILDYTISLAFDDSCGASTIMLRSSIRVFRGERDVTDAVFYTAPHSTLEATAANISEALRYCSIFGEPLDESRA